MVEPPKATDDPLIVIVEFANFALAIEPASSSFVIDPLGNVIVVPAGNVMVSPFSPIWRAVPDPCGIILFTSSVLIK